VLEKQSVTPIQLPALYLDQLNKKKMENRNDFQQPRLVANLILHSNQM
jgi:hypothetical protein